MRIDLRRALPHALLVLVALVACWPILRTRGMPYNVDISGFFPLSPDAYEGRFWPLWNERGGMSTAQFLPALAFELPLLLAGRALGWGMDTHLKVRVVLGFALAGIAMYALARHYVAKRHPDAPRMLGVVAPMAAALLYMLNPWSVHRVFHYFLWMGYAMTPLVVLAFERLAEAPSWRRGLALAGVAAVATTDPHNPATFAIVLLPLLALRLAPLAWRDRQAFRRVAGALLVAAGAYLLLAAYWILPYAYNALTNPGFGPTYVMSDQMLDTLSRNAGPLETLRLLHNYLPRGDLQPAGGLALELWTVASFGVPILAFAALLADRSRVAWTYATLAAATILLGMGSRGPFPGGYHWLLFDAPWGEGLSWLFRDPYRWGGLQALAYGVLLALCLAGIPATLASVRIRVPTASPAIAIGVVLLFCAPALASYTTGAYAPVVVPSEYAEANAYLAQAPADAGVLWMPKTLGSTTWSGDRTVEYFDATSSARSAMGPFRPHTSAYFDFVQDAIKDGAPIAPLLARAGADRILYHNDVDPVAGARAARQIATLGLDVDDAFGDSATLVVDASSAAAPYTPAAKFALYGDRELAQSFVPQRSTLAQLALRVDDQGAPGPLRVSILDANGSEVFAKNVSVGTKDVSVPLHDLRVTPGQPYTLLLQASPASGPDDRFDVSYYKIDTYDDGELADVGGDLHFDMLARAKGFATALVAPTTAPRLRESARVVASPDGLSLLRAIDMLPEASALREAPILFLDSSNDAGRIYAKGNAPWTYVAGLDEEGLGGVAPFVNASDFLSPFAATQTADTKQGWARGTQDFTYYDWGWKRSLASLGQESWEFDGGDGLVYASVPANLTIPASPSREPSVLLARLHESPRGGPLVAHADGPRGGALVGRVDTRANVSGFRWVDLGDAPAGATSIRLENVAGFQGLDELALVPRSAFDAARAQAHARLASGPFTLLAQAETVPGLDARTVNVAGVGRVSDLTRPTNVTFRLPVPAQPTLWLRIPATATTPSIRVDGALLGGATCAADCDANATWFALQLPAMAAGPHVLRLDGATGNALVDVIAISTDPAFAGGAASPVAWTRVSATQYHARVSGGGLLALAVPYDAGWVARVAGSNGPIRSVEIDGVANGFLLPTDARDVTITYEPQTWANVGAGIALVTTGLLTALACGATILRRVRRDAPKEVAP